MMAPTEKEKWRVRGAVIGIFLLGGIAGALAMNLYRDAHSASGRPAERRGFGRVFDSMNLTADQQARIDQILSDSRKKLMEVRRESIPQFEAIRKDTEDRLKAVLTPEQWQQFQDQLQQQRGRFRDHRPRRGMDRGDRFLPIPPQNNPPSQTPSP